MFGESEYSSLWWSVTAVRLYYMDTSGQESGLYPGKPPGLQEAHAGCLVENELQQVMMEAEGQWSSELKGSHWVRREDGRVRGAAKLRVILSSWWADSFIIMQWHTSTSLMCFVGKATWFNTNAVTPAFCPLGFTCCTLSHPFTFSISPCYLDVSLENRILDVKF